MGGEIRRCDFQPRMNTDAHGFYRVNANFKSGNGAARNASGEGDVRGARERRAADVRFRAPERRGNEGRNAFAPKRGVSETFVRICGCRTELVSPQSPVGAAPKETPGGSPGMHAKRKSLVKATLFPRRTDAPGAGSLRRGLSDFPPCPRFPPGVSKRVVPGGGFSKCGRIFKSPDGAELPSVGCQPYGNGNENDARCKCAIAGTRGRGKSPAELAD